MSHKGQKRLKIMRKKALYWANINSLNNMTKKEKILQSYIVFCFKNIHFELSFAKMRFLLDI